MKIRIGILIRLSLLSYAVTTFCVAYSAAPWSAVYEEKFSTDDRVKKRSQKEKTLKKDGVVPFTQLLLSWNALRPTDGQYDFFIRAHTQGAPLEQWNEWHKVASWGDSIQKSYFSRGKGTIFNYVRLEMEQGLLGDGFEVKVVAQGNKASLDRVKALFVCASNYKEFAPERPYLAGKNAASLRITGITEKSQQVIDHPRAGALCSPTTVSMILEALLREPVDSLETAQGVYDEALDAFGNWSFNTAYAFERARGKCFFYTARLASFGHLYEYLKQGIPVGVSIRGRIKGGKKAYPNGHLIVVAGFDAQQQKVICYDPAFDTPDQVLVEYNIAEFIPAWERSYRLAYVAQAR